MKREKVDIVNKKSLSTSDEVFDQIHTIMHLFRSRQYRGVGEGPQEMTHMEGKLLGFFARHPGATLSDLVAQSGRDKGQLARLIKGLKDAGLLGTQKGESNDRRSVRLELSRAGHKIHDTLHRQSDLLAKAAVKGLSSAECKQLVQLLQRVRTNLEAP